MTASGETAGVQPVTKGKGKLLLVAGVGLALVAGGGGAAAWYAGLFAGPGAAAEAAVPMVDGHAAGVGEPSPAPAVAFVDIPDLLVNLRSDSPRLRYLKLRLALEVDGEPTADAVRRLMPRIMDSFQLYLRALTLDDVQGATGMQRLKEELGARANLAVDPVRVSSVLLKEMLVQ